MRVPGGLVVLAAMLVGACAPTSRPSPPGPDGPPQRVVSLDYCADQYVLKLLPRERILAVSVEAGRNYSAMRSASTGIRQVRPLAEDVLLLKPDLVVVSYAGGPGLETLLARVGIPLLRIRPASEVSDLLPVLLEAAHGLHARPAGEALAAETGARLETLARTRTEGTMPTALYLTAGGVTAGPGTLIADMLARSGFLSFETRPGWQGLPLERLARDAPDLVAAAFLEAGRLERDPWSAASHPLARAQLHDRPSVMLDGAWTACGGWFLLDAMEALARARPAGRDGKRP